MITTLAARGSRSRAWVGLGHVPVLMAAATAAACIVPLALANAVAGLMLALGALSLLLAGHRLRPSLATARRPAAARLRAGSRRAARSESEVRVNV